MMRGDGLYEGQKKGLSRCGEQLGQRSRIGKPGGLSIGQSAGDEGQRGPQVPASLVFFLSVLKSIWRVFRKRRHLLACEKIFLRRARLRGVFLGGGESMEEQEEGRSLWRSLFQ